MKLIHVFHSNTESNLVYNAIQYILDTQRTHFIIRSAKTTHHTHFVPYRCYWFILPILQSHSFTDGVRK